MIFLPESHFPFPEQSCKHKESATLEPEIRLRVVVSGMLDNGTPRPLLASTFTNLPFKTFGSFFITFWSSSPLNEILSKQSSFKCFKWREAVPAFPENNRSNRQSWTYLKLRIWDDDFLQIPKLNRIQEKIFVRIVKKLIFSWFSHLFTSTKFWQSLNEGPELRRISSQRELPPEFWRPPKRY